MITKKLISQTTGHKISAQFAHLKPSSLLVDGEALERQNALVSATIHQKTVLYSMNYYISDAIFIDF